MAKRTPFLARVATLSLVVSAAGLAACARQDTKEASVSPASQSSPSNAATPDNASRQRTPIPDTHTAEVSAPSAGSAFQTHATNGTIEGIDRARRAVTIAHEAIPSLKWPAMTMEFKVQSEGQLAGLRTGEAVKFSFVERPAGQYVIADIAAQR